MAPPGSFGRLFARRPPTAAPPPTRAPAPKPAAGAPASNPLWFRLATSMPSGGAPSAGVIQRQPAAGAQPQADACCTDGATCQGPACGGTASGGTQGLVAEPNGGCGVCKAPALIGSEIHRLVQTQSFPANVRAELTLQTPITSPLDEENGRLDLARFVFDRYPKVTIEIGEIKPNNMKGIRDGERDLMFYRQRLLALLAENPPPFDVAVDYMTDVRPNPSVLTYHETASCAPQALTVGGTKGLYLYSCSPPTSQMNRECCKKKDEDEEAIDDVLKESQLAGIGMHMGQLLSDAVRRRMKRRTVTQAAKIAARAAVGGGGRRAAAASLVSKLNLVGDAAAISLFVGEVLGQYVYANVYSPRGHNLESTLNRLVGSAQALGEAQARTAEMLDAFEVARAQTPGGSEPELVLLDGDTKEEARTVLFRTAVFDSMVDLRKAVSRSARDLSAAGKEFSAIGKRLDAPYPSGTDLTLEILDGYIQSGDDSDDALDMMDIQLDALVEVTAARYLLIFDDLQGVAKDDQDAWLKRRR